MNRRFVLDVDGTIITCKDRHVGLAESVLKSWDLRLDRELFWAAKRAGATTRVALESIGIPKSIASRASAEWMAHIEDPKWLQADELFPGTIEVLQGLRNRGYRLTFLTARRHRESTRVQLETLGVLDNNDDLIVVPPGKPLEKTLVLRNLRPVGVVGDSEQDAYAAVTSGTPYAIVCTGQREEGFLRSQGVGEIFFDLNSAVESLLKPTGLDYQDA